jgi:nickel-dependent lactate racemase
MQERLYASIPAVYSCRAQDIGSSIVAQSLSCDTDHNIQAMAKVTIPYGSDGQLSVEIPDRNLTEVLSPNRVDVPPNPRQPIEEALNRPVGSDPIEDIVRRKRNQDGKDVCIICDDVTRSTPGHLIIPPILKRLNQAGVHDENVFLVIALGTHRPMTEKEIVGKVGQEVMSRVRVYNSEFRDKTDGLVKVGTSPDGVPVWVDRRVAEARVRIGLGSILPHPAAGCSGGAKIVVPGVTGEDTVASFHLQYAATPQNLFGQPCTPAREIMERVVGVIGLEFIVNVISTPDDEIYRVVAGDYVKAHRKGVRFLQEVCGIRATGHPDIVICSSYPANLDFWQATKAVFAPDFWARSGGSIILAAECPEGIGPHSEYADYIGDDNPEQLLKDAYAGRTAEPIAVSGGVTLARMRMEKRFSLVSDGLERRHVARMKWRAYDNLQEALDLELKRYGPDATVGVFTHGGSSFPYFLTTAGPER